MGRIAGRYKTTESRKKIFTLLNGCYRLFHQMAEALVTFFVFLFRERIFPVRTDCVNRCDQCPAVLGIDHEEELEPRLVPGMSHEGHRMLAGAARKEKK